MQAAPPAGEGGHRPVIVYKSDAERSRAWAEVFAAEAPEFELRLWPDVGDGTRVRWLAAWEPPDRLLERFPQLDVLFSTGAGADQYDLAALPAGVRVVRMIEPDLVAGMVEYVVHAVLDVHRDMPAYRRQQAKVLAAFLVANGIEEASEIDNEAVLRFWERRAGVAVHHARLASLRAWQRGGDAIRGGAVSTHRHGAG